MPSSTIQTCDAGGTEGSGGAGVCSAFESSERFIFDVVVDVVVVGVVPTFTMRRDCRNQIEAYKSPAHASNGRTKSSTLCIQKCCCVDDIHKIILHFWFKK